MKRFAYLDALRGVAILGVLLVHANANVVERAHLPSLWLRFIDVGQMGVQLFFMVSAYTLYHALATRRAQGPFSLRDFAVRRFFRLAPLYYVGIGYYVLRHVVAPWLMDQPTHAQPDAVLANVLFVHALHPAWINNVVMGGWSIGVEVLFYALVPGLFAVVTTFRRSLYLLAGCLLVSLLNNWVANLAFDPARPELYTFGYLWLPSQLVGFAVGIALYFAEARFAPRPWLFWTGWLTALVVLLTVAPFGGWPPVLDNQPTGLFAHVAVLPLLAALFLYLRQAPRSVLVNRFTGYVGTISYSLYVVHPPVLHVVEKGLPLPYAPDAPLLTAALYALRLALTLGVTLAVATLTHRFIEQPFIRLGTQFLGSRRAVAKPVAEVVSAD